MPVRLLAWSLVLLIVTVNVTGFLWAGGLNLAADQLALRVGVMTGYAVLGFVFAFACDRWSRLLNALLGRPHTD